MDTGRIWSATAKGLFLSTEMIFIVFSSLFIIEILKKKELASYLKSFFEWISKDRRVHILLVGWALIYFLESVAGFGTPAMLALPILLALGFNPLTSVIVSLIGNAIPTIFGAIGLPITFGIGSVLESFGRGDLMNSLPIAIACLNIIGNTLAPLIMLYIFCKMEQKPFKHFREFIPFVLVTSAIISTASILTALFLGPELPSVVAGATAILVISLLAKKKILLPKTETTENIGPAPSLYGHKKKIVLSITPYVILLFLLVISRVPFLPVRNILISMSEVKILEIFSYHIDYVFYPLYSAGVLIFISAIISALIFKLNLKDIGGAITFSIKKILKPYIALIFIIALVQIFVYSGENLSGVPSMPIILARAASFVFGGIWPIVAPFVGALGAFAAGSTTVSNLIFTGFQYETALASGFSPLLILSLQALGAAAGNMIALHNIIVLIAVADMSGNEEMIIRKNIPPLLIILLSLGIIGFILSFTSWF
jgi:lactate permease